MNGQRVVTVPLFFQLHIIQLTVPIALLFTFFFPQRMLMFLFFFYYIFAIFIYKYVAFIEKKFQIINEKQTTRLFPEESGQFFIHLKNGASIPLVNGVCYFHLNSSLIPHKEQGIEQISKTLFSFPFSQPAHSAQKWGLTLTATKRGVFQIEQFECVLKDPFHLLTVHLPVFDKLRTEIIVYPSPKEVAGLQELQQLLNGFYRTNFSFYNDETSIIGVKRYERESFRSIHWKASAKMQQLQAKQYEPVKNYSWTICLSLAADRGFGWKDNVEELISYATYIFQYTTKHHIPFELFISVLAEGGALHVPLNEGQTQYAKALEELACISDDSTLLPKQGFLHYVKRKRERSSTMIYIGLQRNELPLLSQPTFLITSEGMVEPVENLAISHS
ncbi:DUF58 domain-containing protein [Bacillus cereus]|uniref:DUF58 domain-containing protein n=1 Tax=Bacillus cereus TaxID=1396 RepID=UPI000BF884ED|nr:DUF58 domain-containing protein [Bacillus cereus]PER09495.1 DUF58 domain-containing protein [Bacillus cereus]PEW57765.1 DUF58 domain-containing protein [Bacillus cereus]PEX58656.1 DUF58 domain-containing protein [Bacillus cereus]PEZ89801.1 DUF58 domain-containing protein [Bacillus cereus]PFE96217.1 DUF58 domain-containing protein [Bacillus cereus]